MTETPVALRNAFGFTSTLTVAEWYSGNGWPHLIMKYRVEHDRDRAFHIAHGAELGPVTYSEETDEFGGMSGEWRSEIIRPADAAA